MGRSEGLGLRAAALAAGAVLACVAPRNGGDRRAADGAAEVAVDALDAATADVIDVSVDLTTDAAPPPEVGFDALDAASEAAPDLPADARDDAVADARDDATSDASSVDASDVPGAETGLPDREDAPGDGADVVDAPCPPGQALCAGRCMDTLSDPRNCGACGRACDPREDCASGACAAMRIAAVSAGYHNTCARSAGGSAWCWGSNEYGNIPEAAPNATLTTPVRLTSVYDVREILACGSNSIAIHSGGTAQDWGTDAITVTPAAFGVTPAQQTCGDPYCIRFVDGTARCYGNNNLGLLGVGDATRRGGQVWEMPIGLRDVAEIRSGEYYSCARTTGGSVLCWGANAQGQLGNGSTGGTMCGGSSCNPTPTAVPGMTSVRALAVGFRFVCVTRDVSGTNQLWCWGEGLGPTPVMRPVAGGIEQLSIHPFGGHVCVRHTDGTASCWGQNGSGQLGSGDTSSASAFVPVRGLTEVVDISAGRGHTCAVRRNGEVFCWGDNTRGRLGIGTAVGNATTPRRVLF